MAKLYFFFIVFIFALSLSLYSYQIGTTKSSRNLNNVVKFCPYASNLLQNPNFLNDFEGWNATGSIEYPLKLDFHSEQHQTQHGIKLSSSNSSICQSISMPPCRLTSFEFGFTRTSLEISNVGSYFDFGVSIELEFADILSKVNFFADPRFQVIFPFNKTIFSNKQYQIKKSFLSPHPQAQISNINVCFFIQGNWNASVQYENVFLTIVPYSSTPTASVSNNNTNDSTNSTNSTSSQQQFPSALNLAQPIEEISQAQNQLEEDEERNKSLQSTTLATPVNPHFLSIIAMSRGDRGAMILPIFTNYLGPYLEQTIGKDNFEIIVVEQTDNLPFNRAFLMNIGVLNASEKADYFIFHDLDLLPYPETDYSFPKDLMKAEHMSHVTCHYNKAWQCEEFYGRCVGGVLKISKEAFYRVNGYSNLFWGFGGEDDEFYCRMVTKKVSLLHGPKNKYWHIEGPRVASNKAKHPDYQTNVKLMYSLCDGKRKQEEDGLSTIPDFGEENGISVIAAFQFDDWCRVISIFQKDCRKTQNCTFVPLNSETETTSTLPPTIAPSSSTSTPAQATTQSPTILQTTISSIPISETTKHSQLSTQEPKNEQTSFVINASAQ